MGEVLRKRGLSVRIHDEEFRPDTADTAWLPVTGTKGWIVLTEDADIRYSTDETDALMLYRNRAFVFRIKGGTTAKILEAFDAALPRIRRMLRKQEEPFIAKVYRHGSVKLWLTYQKWLEDRSRFLLHSEAAGGSL